MYFRKESEPYMTLAVRGSAKKGDSRVQEVTEITTNLPGVAAGPNFTQEAVATVWQPAAGPFIAIAIALFALTTIVAFYFIAEANLAYLVGHRNPVLVRILEVAILAVTFYSTIRTDLRVRNRHQDPQGLRPAAQGRPRPGVQSDHAGHQARHLLGRPQPDR